MARELRPFQREDGEYVSGRFATLVAHEPRVGKALPVDTPVMTPIGPVPMGSIRAGDYVLGAEGRAVLVKSVWPQGVQDAYRVTFRDGSSVECNVDHLWAVTEMNRRRAGLGFTVKPLSELVERGLQYKNGKTKWSIPAQGPAAFHSACQRITPYALGVLIAEGSFSNGVEFSLADRDVDMLPAMQSLACAFGLKLTPHRTGPNVVQYRYSNPSMGCAPNPLARCIRELGLNVKSPERFIPEEYKVASVEQRRMLLRGLLDADGHCAKRDKSSSTSYSTHSLRLARDVCWLVRSLGGQATQAAYDRGVKGVEYRVRMQTRFNPFTTAFKAGRWSPVDTPDCKIVRAITSVEYSRTVEQVCIEVDAADGLYLTEDFIVTHNTNIAIHGADLVEAEIVVVICPAAVRNNWRQAIVEFRGGQWWGIVASYNKARAVLRVLKGRKYVLVIDEGHYAKERDTDRTKAVYGTLCDKIGGLAEYATNVFVLTGTPMPNNPGELWPMLRSLAPEIIDNGFGRPLSFSRFRDKYCKMINTPFGVKIAGSKNYKELKQKLEGFVIRRTRKDVFGRDLQPPTSVYVRAKPTDAKALESLMQTEQGRVVAEALQSSNPLKALARLEKHVAGLRKLFGLAKVPGVVDIVSEELDAEPKMKIVLFAYHHVVIDALKQNLKKYGIEAFDGRTTDARKIRIQERFRNDPKCRVVVGQLDAMGVGLDFSTANDTLFVEQSWVGTTNAQAMSRIFNMNSPEPKFTRFVVLVGSVDEQIAAACARKLADEQKLFG